MTGPATSALLRRRRARPPSGRLYALVRSSGALVFAAVVITLVVVLVSQAWPALRHSGFGLVFGTTWNPDAKQFGAGVFVVDTLLTTGLAMLVVFPVGLGAAIALSELTPRWLSAPLGTAVDLVAAVPSIVVGLWGLLVLEPLFSRDVEPFFQSVPGLRHLFSGPALGSGVLLASTVLAVMALPTMVALSRTALAGVGVADREAALALGATRWQVVRRAVLPGARSGIQAAVTLAVGRAFGEVIAVAMVIGGGVTLPHSLLANGTTLGSAVVNSFGDALGLQRSAVIALVLVLLLLSALVNVGGQWLLRRRSKSSAFLPPGPPEPIPLAGAPL
jgi:phosphate transport system permease protein